MMPSETTLTVGKSRADLQISRPLDLADLLLRAPPDLGAPRCRALLRALDLRGDALLGAVELSKEGAKGEPQRCSYTIIG